MSKKDFFFERIDNFLLIQTEQMTKSIYYQKIVDYFSSLNDQQKKVINRSLSIFSVVAPLLIVSFVFFTNLSLKSKINDQQETITSIKKYLQQKDHLSNINKTYVTKSSLSTKSSLQNKLKSILRKNSISLSNATLKNFDIDNENASIVKVKGLITFKKFTTVELSSLFKEIFYRERIKINMIKVEKDKKNDLLKGSVGILYFTKK